MQAMTIQRAMVTAIAMAITPMQASAVQTNAVEWDGSPLILAMGPDPGGKSGAGVTPETTRTDHPAAGGPQSPSKPDSSTGPGDRNGKQAGSKEPAPTPSPRQR
jgi:hypothetical protein